MEAPPCDRVEFARVRSTYQDGILVTICTIFSVKVLGDFVVITLLGMDGATKSPAHTLVEP